MTKHILVLNASLPPESISFTKNISINPPQVTSAQFGQTVLLLKLKIS